MNTRNAAICRAIARAKKTHAEHFVYSVDDAETSGLEYVVSRDPEYDLSDEGIAWDAALEAVIGPYGSVLDSDEYRYGPLPYEAA